MLIALTEKIQSCHALLWSLERKVGRNGVLRCFQQLRSYCDGIETRNQEEILFT